MLKETLEKYFDMRKTISDTEDPLLIKHYIFVGKQAVSLALREKGSPLSFLTVAIMSPSFDEQKECMLRYLESFNPEDDCFDISSYLRILSDACAKEKDFESAAIFHEAYQNSFDKNYYVDENLLAWDKESQRLYHPNAKELRLVEQTANKKAGEYYLKSSTQKAIDYWNRQKKRIYYQTSEDFKKIVDQELLLVLKKHAKGYVYKPRNKKIPL